MHLKGNNRINMEDKVLTICIPTYNRRERLLKQLDSLYAQPEVYQTIIQIIDNHSDYDVESTIVEHFGKEKVSNLKVHVNPVNLGLEPNICMPFLMTQTKWLWTLGDDDETMPDSISTVLSHIKNSDDTAFFIFSISNLLHHIDNKFGELEEFIDYWYKDHRVNGDLVFLSNKVYNMEYVTPYIGIAIKNCLNCVGHIVPMLHCLNDKKGIVQICSSSIVTYKEADPNSGWSFIKIALEFSLISYLYLDIPHKSFKHLCASFGNSFGNVSFINLCLNFKPRYKGKFIFLEVYHKLLKYKGFVSRCSWGVFFFCYIFHINYNDAIPFMRKVWNKFHR